MILLRCEVRCQIRIPTHAVSPETLIEACKLFKENQVEVIDLVYRAKGYFTGRELYFYDPSGNRLELRDPTWQQGMPEPSFDEVVAS